MSPIHDQSYRRYAGARRPPGRAWLVIARAGVRDMMTRKWLWVILLLGWIPFVVQVVRFYLFMNVAALAGGRASFLAVTPETFRTFLSTQGFFVYLVTVFVGSELVANDRRANALQIYLSKPLMRIEYILGKFAVLAIYLLLVTLIPELLLLLAQAMFSGSFDFLRQNLYLIPAVTLGSLVEVIVAASTMLALSSLSKSRRYAALLYTGAIFFSNAMFGVLTVVTGGTRVAWVSLTANMDQVVDAIFRQTPHDESPWGVSLVILAGLVAVSLSTLERRVRGVEIIS